MSGLRRGDRQNAAPQPGFAQTARPRPLQHARTVRAEPAPGDYQHTTAAVAVAGLDKFDQSTMRFGLSQAVQVEPRLDWTQTALQPLGIGPVDAAEVLDRGLMGLGQRTVFDGRRLSPRWIG